MCRCIFYKTSKLSCFIGIASRSYKGKQLFSSKAYQIDDQDEPVAFGCIDTTDGSKGKAPFASLLRSLGLAGALADGRQVHSSIVLKGLEGKSFVGNLLVQMYARCLDLESTQFCFHRIQARNVFSWNFLISAYDGLGQYTEVLCCFQQMQSESVIPDSVTFVHVLSAYTSNQTSLLHGKVLHACILSMELDSNIILATALFNLYGKGSNWDLAWSTFAHMQEQDLASWNAFIAVCALQGQHRVAFRIYRQLHEESFIRDDITLVNVFTVLGAPETLTLGKQVHASIHHEEIVSNCFLGTALVSMYGKCGSIRSAQFVFDQMSVRNVVTWNAMITMYAQHGRGQEAMQLYQHMQQHGLAINNFTFVGLLDACAREKLLVAGKILHICLTKYAFDVDVSVGIALVNMYNKCLSLQDGQDVFNLLLVQDVTSCNAMMTGYIHLGHGKEAMDIFDQMEHQKMVLDNMTVSIVLCACAIEASLVKGKSIHCMVLRSGFDSDLVIRNSILNMYGKCGCVISAQNVFSRMPEKNLVSWNCLMALHAQHGNCFEVFELLLKMERDEVVPDKTSFTSVLSACSHAGLVNVGCFFSFTVLSESSLLGSIDHFDCMIDMVGRAGQLDEAENFVTKMPMQPRNLSWTTFHSACKCSADAIRGFLAAKHRVELEIGDATAFLTLSNIYAASGRKQSTSKVMNSLLIEDLKMSQSLFPDNVYEN
ncbi:hypothetical protein L7F22_006625 [Adiantum nelumboides]|nr:hypothetical protein [Adiantum nelumboides]